MEGDRTVGKLAFYRKTCVACNSEKVIPMTEEQYIRLENGLSEGVHIQDAVPDMKPKWREMFISGICPDCWKKIFRG